MPIRDRDLQRHLFLAGAIAACWGGLLACGTEDYQKPVAQFQTASSVVIAATRTMLAHVNSVEQDNLIDQAIFGHKTIDIPQIRSYKLISPEEIDVRVKALDALQAYASTLASLAEGKNVSAISDQTRGLGQALGALSKQAANLPVSQASFLKNADLGNALKVVATGVGLVAEMVAQHKAQAQLEKAIEGNQKPIGELIGLLAEELDGAYQRQKATLSAEQIYISKAYEQERSESHPDPNALLLLGDRMKSYLREREVLEAADPAPSLRSMQAAHNALVACAKSKHDPKSLRDLQNAAQGFVNEVQPFGQGIEALLNVK